MVLKDNCLMKDCAKRHADNRKGSVLVLVMVSVMILSALGIGLLTVSFGVRHRAIMEKNETIAMLAAEAGYEKAVFWMSQQKDMLSALQNNDSGTTGTLSFPDGSCSYNIELFSFAGARPVYRIISNGSSGVFKRTVDVHVIQAISGWDMGKCRIPSDSSSTTPVYYVNGEIIDIPIHINDLKDSPDYRDIYISGSPDFSRTVAMSESRYRSGGYDKYSGVMNLFDEGIFFNQPDSKITDEAAVQTKIDRFKNSTTNLFSLTPTANAAVSNPLPAVQLEFFIDNQNKGKVRVTNNCTVRGFKQSSDSRTWDFKVKSGSSGENFERYYIYAYHLQRGNAATEGSQFTRLVEKSYVSQSIGGIESEPGGQIFVDGNVIIGGDKTQHSGNQLVKGKITVVATGNIWIADSILLDGPHDSDGTPSEDNPNILGLIAQGVVKVIDPGMSDYSYVDGSPVEPPGHSYAPIGLIDSGEPNGSHKRHLPDPMIVEAAITVGGGGWGAENVRKSSSYGGRKDTSSSSTNDRLTVHGTIVEATRGIVGSGTDGFIKHYYLDERLLEGILPGDFWLRGKYIPAPAGWHDYRTEN